MNKIAIIYVSVHHKNTKKLLEDMAKEVPVDLFTIEEAKTKNLTEYDMVGIASGIFYGKMHENVLNFLKSGPNLPKDIFAIITCGDGGKKHIRDAKIVVESYGFDFMGAFVCKGFDTYGLFKLIGGINKKHPNNTDVKKCIEFMNGINEM